jgi:outer membrane protein assembly factor BamB
MLMRRDFQIWQGLVSGSGGAWLLAVVAMLALVPQVLRAAEPVKKYRLMFFEYGKGPNRLLELDSEGKVIWEHRPPSIAVIFQVLPGGNVLYAYGGKPTGVREVNRKGEEVWNYVSKSAQVLGCERLDNGNTLVAEQGPCQAVEVNRQGEVVHVTPLTTSHQDPHLQVRNIHRLANGNILAAHEGEGAVREVDRSGKVVWEYTNVENAGDAQRLKNGNTLISCGTQKRVLEVTPDKKVAWEFTANDAPELNVTWVSSIQQLKNGNVLVGNFLRGQEGKGAHAFEVTRDKKVVWSWTDHSIIKSLTTVRVLDELEPSR